MAARYWIGGTGNWSDTAHWSATSGGVGGASVPTMDDDVYFDSNSGTGTVTVNAIANMRDCTFAQTQLITLTNAAYAFNIYGNWTLCSNTYLNTSFTGTGYVYLKATTSVNVTSNGCTRGWNYLYFDGIGGTWTNQDDWLFNPTMNFYMRNGHWNTNSFRMGGYSMFIWRLYTEGIGTKIISLQSSLLKNCNIRFEQNSNFTFNCGTSVIYAQAYFNGAGFTFYSVVMDYTTGGPILGNNTFSYLNLYPTPDPRFTMGIYGNNTIINEFNISGYSSRCLIASGNIGTPRTITCNGTITASNVDFRDIVGAGTANWDLSAITGGSGDCGGNSGITFTPAQTQYFKHTLGAVNWSDATKWFSNYERSIQGRVPLPQDNAIFDENSFTGASTLNVNMTRIGRSLDMSGVNVSLGFLFSFNQNVDIYGSLKFSSTCGNWVAAGMRVNFLARGSYVIDQKNVGIYGHIIGTPTSDYTVVSEIYAIEMFAVNAGIFRLNGYNINVAYSSNTYYRFNGGTVYAGSGTIHMTRGTGTSFYINSNCNFVPESSTVKFSPSSSSSNIPLELNGKSLNKVWLSGSHTGNFNIIGKSTIAELIIDSGRKVLFTNGTTQTINKLTAIGTPEQPITIGSTTAGQRHTLNLTGEQIDLDYVTISDSNVIQTNKAYAGNNSIDGGNNVNWIFEALFNPIETWHRKAYNPIIEQEQVYYSVLKQQLNDTVLFTKVLNKIINKKQDVMKESIYYANPEPKKSWFIRLKDWLTNTQIKIENAISKSFLLHDYVGSWIAILSLLLVLIFDFNIYIVVVNPIIAGITKELSDKFIRKVKPEFMDFISTAIKGVVLYILLLLLGY